MSHDGQSVENAGSGMAIGIAIGLGTEIAIGAGLSNR